MINNRVVETLNRCGIGCDVNKLEQYVLSAMLCNKIVWSYKYSSLDRLLEGILREIKPESQVFKYIDTDTNNIDTSKYLKTSDVYTYNVPDIHNITVYNLINNEDIQRFISSIDNKIDIIGYPNILGIDICCCYYKGYLQNISIINNYKLSYDITDKLSDFIDNYIEDFENKDTILLIGRVTIEFNNDNEFIGVEQHVMQILRTGIGIHKLQVFFNDIYEIGESEEINSLKLWDRLEYIRKHGINTYKHSIARNVYKNDIISAINNFSEHFNAMRGTKIEYEFSGVVITQNSDHSNASTNIVYVDNNVDENKTFKSSVKNLEFDCNGVILHIINTKCNKYLVVDQIKLYDVYLLEQYGIHNGSEVTFNIINKEPNLYIDGKTKNNVEG